MLFNRYYYFSSNEHQSPTSLQLVKHLKLQGWRRSYFKQWANFSEDNLLFDEQAAQALEYKHLFANLCKRYCSEFTPETYLIDDNNWPELLDYLSESFSREQNLVWILKPALLNNGQGIFLFQRFRDIEHHYLNKNRLGGPHVLQKYLKYPHLLKGPAYGHKYSMRMFIILSNVYGVFLYPHGYFNIALHPYTSHRYDDLSAHLTNEHLSHEKSNVVQVPTWQYALFKPFYSQIKTILVKLLTGFKTEHPQAFQCKKQQKLLIMGFDFIVDSAEKVWLLEANHGPCFPTSSDHPMQDNFYEPFWKALVEEFILNYQGSGNTSVFNRFERLV